MNATRRVIFCMVMTGTCITTQVSAISAFDVRTLLSSASAILQEVNGKPGSFLEAWQKMSLNAVSSESTLKILIKEKPLEDDAIGDVLSFVKGNAQAQRLLVVSRILVEAAALDIKELHDDHAALSLVVHNNLTKINATLEPLRYATPISGKQKESWEKQWQKLAPEDREGMVSVLIESFKGK